MSTNRLQAGALAGALLVLGLLAITPPAAAQGFERSFTLSADELLLADLIGEIRIERAAGDLFEVEVKVDGEDAAEELIEFEQEEGTRGQLLILFPTDEHRRYVYPRLGRHSKTNFTFGGGRGWLNELLRHRHRVEVHGRGRGLEIWADVTVRVPAGKALRVQLGVGEIMAADIEGNLDLDTSSGGIVAERVHGDVRIDTGSGGVELEEIAGNLRVDTGSGGVELIGCNGKEVSIDTGSGSVFVEGVYCEELEIDTGSGRVEAVKIAADDAVIDTGSGSITLVLERMGSGRFNLDTGSGGIELVLPPDASAHVEADTGSGSIRADVDGVRLPRRRRDRDHLAFTIGDGEAEVYLDTGSGSIRIRQ